MPHNVSIMCVNRRRVYGEADRNLKEPELLWQEEGGWSSTVITSSFLSSDLLLCHMYRKECVCRCWEETEQVLHEEGPLCKTTAWGTLTSTVMSVNVVIVFVTAVDTNTTNNTAFNDTFKNKVFMCRS